MDISTPVLVDAVAIIEAHKLNIWRSLAAAFHFETVEQCIMETQTGWQRRKPEEQIDEKTLRGQLRGVHSVSDDDLALVIASGGIGLDSGEKALWAHAMRREDAWVLCGPDWASMKFGYDTQNRERLITFEQLTSRIRLNVTLRPHFTQAWLDKKISNHALGIL
ncbi:hypothetical protein [Brucella pseudogrignonensis]|uniref:hypothetical protein n=1 Tax=Brucella pseudogrignonensis TaxID=419475 RepID=UPI0038D01CD8